MLNSVQQNYGKQQVGFGAKYEIYGATRVVKKAYKMIERISAKQGIETAYVDTHIGIRECSLSSDIKPSMLDKVNSFINPRRTRKNGRKSNRINVHCTDRVVVTTAGDAAKLNKALRAKEAGERYEKKYGKVLEREYFPLSSQGGDFNVLNAFMETITKGMQHERNFNKSMGACVRFQEKLWKAGKGKWIEYSNSLPSHCVSKPRPSDIFIKATEVIKAIQQGTFDVITGLKKEA